MSWSCCLVCGHPTSDDVLSITPYGLHAICGDQCLNIINNSDCMPPRVKLLYDQQQAKLKENKSNC